MLASECGIRLKNLFENLVKLNSGKINYKSKEDELLQYRHVTTKLCAYFDGQDKINREAILKNGIYVSSLIQVLKVSTDRQSIENVVKIVLDLIGKQNTGKRSIILIQNGATQAFFHLLVSTNKTSSPCDEILYCIHHVLYKLGLKDRKFGSKARLCQALTVTLSLVHHHLLMNTKKVKFLSDLLSVLKLYCNNQCNSSTLGRHGAVNHMIFILAKKNHTLTKLAMETLALLVKSKNNSVRCIKQGAVPLLLHHFEETQYRQVSVAKSALFVLRQLINLHSGRRVFLEHSGMPLLFNFCENATKRKLSDLDALVLIASIILRKCFPRNKLPVSTVDSPFHLSLPRSLVSDVMLLDVLPNSEAYNALVSAETCSSSDTGYVASCKERIRNYYDSRCTNTATSSDVEDESNSEEEEKKLRKVTTLPPPPIESSSSSSQGLAETNVNCDCPSSAAYHDLSKRSLHELQQEFEHLFPELADFECESSSNSSQLASAKELECLAHTIQDRDRLLLTNAFGGCGARNLPELESRHHRPAAAASVSSFRRHAGYGDIVVQRNHNIDSAPLSRRRAPHHLKDLLALSSPSPTPSLLRIDGVNATSSIQRLNVSAVNKKVALLKKSSFLDRERLTAPKLRRNSEPLSSSSSKLLDSVEMDEDGDSNELSLHTRLYVKLAAKTRSLTRFVMLAYPDLIGARPPLDKEAFTEKKISSVQSELILEDLRRVIEPIDVFNHVVFDLDALISTSGTSYTSSPFCSSLELSNHDEVELQKVDNSVQHLLFESRFESGNLRKAIQIRQNEYDLLLCPDVNSNHHVQWFYFRVSNILAGVKYRFNFINCEKPNSQFNFGMKPLAFSVTEAWHGRPYWLRVGSKICYYKNHFTRSPQTSGGFLGRNYYTTSFTLTFKHHGDIVYLAYHYPYTYTHLAVDCKRWQVAAEMHQTRGVPLYFRSKPLAQTLLGNVATLLTITTPPRDLSMDSIEAFRKKPYVVLTSRVHPGESNASWCMRGTIQALLADTPLALALRDNFIFKIVPMLNPDGVLQGNHRCGMSGEDLNRRWAMPCPRLHPIIYSTKGLLMYLSRSGRTPLVYADYHGHSRKKNVFMYGCSAFQTWLAEDTLNPAWIDSRVEDQAYKCLPRILDSISAVFSLSSCNYEVEKVKESTARVVVWRQCGVLRSYTVESTYHGCDQGHMRGYHVKTSDLEQLGANFVEALLQLRAQCEPMLASTDKETVASRIDICRKRCPKLSDSIAAIFSDLDLPDDEDDVNNDVMMEDENFADIDFFDDEDENELVLQASESSTPAWWAPV